jgi:L-erythro-3,5-diaminohexanoate dehydrogenase
LAALDVAGAPAQTAKLVKPCDSVLILGANGKSGILCAYEAVKRVGPTGNVVAMVRSEEKGRELLELGVCHKFIISDATYPVDLLEKSLAVNNGKEYDISISCVNVANCEMSAILPVRDGGLVYFFSMATSFTKAALGAEGIGKDVTMIIGNGYTKDHADITLSELRECKKIRDLFKEKYI